MKMKALLAQLLLAIGLISFGAMIDIASATETKSDQTSSPEQTTQSKQSSSCEEYGPLGIPKWFRGLVDANCEIKSPEDKVDSNGKIVEDGMQRFVVVVILNVSDMILRTVGLLVTAFIVFAGFKYMLAQGDPNQMASAKKTITNALIGLVIALMSIIIVNFVFNFFR